MKLAIFDLDNTLIGEDSDHLWGQYLCEQGLMEGETHSAEQERYYADYKAGKLDIHEFLAFQLAPLAGVDMDVLHSRRRRFIEEKIKPVVLEKAIDLVDEHRRKGHTLLIVTATNQFITEPIAGLFGVDNLIASEAEVKNGVYTGKAKGIPSYARGKVERLKMWLNEHGYEPEESWFYSDSHNDIPLLRIVTHPVAVDPDDVLLAEAEKQDWPVISLR